MYDDSDDIKLLCISLPKMIGFVNYFDSNKTISSKVINKKLLESILRLVV